MDTDLQCDSQLLVNLESGFNLLFSILCSLSHTGSHLQMQPYRYVR